MEVILIAIAIISFILSLSLFTVEIFKGGITKGNFKSTYIFFFIFVITIAGYLFLINGGK